MDRRCSIPKEAFRKFQYIEESPNIRVYNIQIKMSSVLVEKRLDQSVIEKYLSHRLLSRVLKPTLSQSFKTILVEWG